VKRINYALLAFATFVAIFTLAGCGDNKQVAEVKALAFSYPNRFAQDPNLTVDQALDTRNVCDSVKWVVKQTDRNQTFVEYTCDYKGVADSGFIERDKSDVASAGDVYQWTYGTDGEPELSYVGVVLHYKNGTSKDFKYDATSIMRVAADNKAANFDDAWSVLRGQPIPIKPALPFTDTTYGNTLTALYPGQSAMKAAAYAYMWKGAPTSFYIFGIDALGYPAVEDSAEAKALVFPVNPADVQIATKVDPSSISTFGANPPSQLQSNKLFCLNEMCYDNTGKLVGRATASVLAQESASNGSAQTAAVAPATDPTTPTGSSDDWPAMTPCIQKLDNAFVKDAQAKGIDSSVNIEQMQEWAATCKALGQ
jgi:hypothetical protein